VTCRTTFLSSAAAALLLVTTARTARATPCVPAHLGPNVAALAEPWRRAVEALVTSTAAEGQPWSCGGGEVSLVVHAGGATLTVVDAGGHAITREVALPDEIEPLGEALLAKPGPFPDAVRSVPVPGARPPGQVPPNELLGVVERGSVGIDPTTAPPPPPPGPPAQPDPRLLLSAVIAPRYAGGSNLVWGGIAAQAALPFGRWAGGFWFRYDGIGASLGERVPPIREACIGASVSRSFGVGPLELRASVRPSVAIVTRSFDPGQQGQPDATHNDFRIGAAAEGVIPITSRLRAVVAFDAELAPQELAFEDHRPDDNLAHFPAYTLGLGVGMEIALR
jgi:hypothetical protein